jgi:S-layer homology domain
MTMNRVLVTLSMFALLSQAFYSNAVLAQAGPSINPLGTNYSMDWGLSYTDKKEIPITTVQQIEDVRPADRYFDSVQSLTERFGVMYVYNDGKFHAERNLTRAQLSSFLNDILYRLYELVAASNADTANKPIEIREFIYAYSHSSKPKPVDSTAQIKDINQTDPYFIHLGSLTERWDIDLTDADNYFRPKKTITNKEFYNLIEGVFGYAPNNPKVVNNRPITRGEFIVAFNDVLENIMRNSVKY